MPHVDRRVARTLIVLGKNDPGEVAVDEVEDNSANHRVVIRCVQDGVRDRQTSGYGILTCRPGGSFRLLTVLVGRKHFRRGMHGQPAFVVPRARLYPFLRSHLAGEGSDDPVIAPHDERQVIDDIVDRAVPVGFLVRLNITSPRRFLRLLQPRQDAIGETLGLVCREGADNGGSDVVGAVVLEIIQRAFLPLRQLVL